MKDISDTPRFSNQPENQPGPDAHIRALLAELGSGPDGDPLPPEVATRLDDTLARLVAERSAAPADPETSTRTVVPLRRRWLPRAAVAAAAVIVVGLGGVTVANLGVLTTSSPKGKSDSAAGGSTAAESTPEVAPAQPQQSGGGVAADRKAPADRKAVGGMVDLPQVSAATFASDVTDLLGTQDTATTPEELPGGDTEQDQAEALRASGCPGPRITDGAVLTPVRYDGLPAVLVVHPESAGSRLVEAWDCAGVTRLARATLTP